MNKIYVARHGETDWNLEGRIHGRSNADLSPMGHSQSLRLLGQLKDRPLVAIYTSTLKRSILTAQPIADHFGFSIRKRPELDEMAFGILEGKLLFNHLDEALQEEWDCFRSQRFTYTIPGGENYTDVTTRVKPFIERILRDHEGQEILIVGHRVVNRVLIGLLMEYSKEKILKIDQTNDCLYLVQRNHEARIFHAVDGKFKEGLLLTGGETLI